MITELVVRLSRTGAGEAVMWFTVLLSVVSVAVMIERLIFFTTHKDNVRALAADLNKLLLANDYAAVQRALHDATFVAPDTELGKGLRALANHLAERNTKAPAEHRKRLIEYFSVRSPRFPTAGTLEKPAV